MPGGTALGSSGIQPVTMRIRPGDRAPDFTLPSAGGEPVSLSSLLGAGPVVLFFYPKDGTPGCTAEACAFRDEHERFVEAGARVVGVSSDPIASHERFARKHGLPMTLLSDEGGRVREAYGASGVLGPLLAPRVSFVIDRDGVVRHVFDSQLRFSAHVHKALAVVRSLAQASAPA